MVHPTLGWVHASPDRLIARGRGEKGQGIVEIKCPIHGLPMRIKDQYMCQAQLQMQCTGARWCDLFAYYKGKAAVVGAKCWRIWRSDAYWARMLESLDRFADCLMEDREPTAKDVPMRPRMPPVKTELILLEEEEEEERAPQ